MASLFIRAVSIITIYDQRNVAPIRNAIRREANQLDLPTKDISRLALSIANFAIGATNFSLAKLF